MEQEQKNFYILRIIKGENVITANEITATNLYELRDYISEIYENETGGITIVVSIQLSDTTEQTIDIFDDL